MAILIRGATVMTANGRGETLQDTSILVDGNRIAALDADNHFPVPEKTEIVDGRGCVVIPGFVQTHLHLCQTLFRGLADDLELLDWLQEKIFPFEAAHNDRSMYASAMVGIAELVRSGTTTILDMGSIAHEEEVIRAVGDSGMRAYVGKALMDVNDAYPKLKEPTKDALRSTRALAERWHNSFDGRIKYAAAPRFVLSCSDELLVEVASMVKSTPGMMLHTHASENKSEVEAVRKRCGMENIEYLHHLGLLSSSACLAHCVHLSDHEIDLLSSTQTAVSHCPSSNLKLGSGIARIPDLMKRNVTVSLGADGAPCNNSLDMFREMRLASLLQKPAHGPKAMPARAMFEMATIGGARALGLQDEIGSIEVGKKADLVLLNLNHEWNPLLAGGDLFSSVVYSASPENVESVMIDGAWVLRRKEFVTIDKEKILRDARGELTSLLQRVE